MIHINQFYVWISFSSFWIFFGVIIGCLTFEIAQFWLQIFNFWVVNQNIFRVWHLLVDLIKVNYVFLIVLIRFLISYFLGFHFTNGLLHLKIVSCLNKLTILGQILALIKLVTIQPWGLTINLDHRRYLVDVYLFVLVINTQALITCL
jgi:hypothetical protein